MEYVEPTRSASEEIGVFGAGQGRIQPRRGGNPPRVSKSTLVVAIPAAAAILALGLVGYWASSPGVVTKIPDSAISDAVLSQLNAGPGPWAADGKAQRISAQLRGESCLPQVSPEKLQVSPFAFSGPMAAVAPSTTEPAARTVDPLADDYAKVAAAQKLPLESILSGTSGPAAVISGSTVNEGQEIDGWVVSKIEARKVVLTWKTYTVTLTLK